jgi:hypothetical protein
MGANYSYCQMSSTVARQNPSPEGKVAEIMVPSRSRGGIVIEAGWGVPDAVTLTHPNET